MKEDNKKRLEEIAEWRADSWGIEYDESLYLVSEYFKLFGEYLVHLRDLPECENIEKVRDAVKNKKPLPPFPEGRLT